MSNYYQCEIESYQIQRGVEMGGGTTWKPWKLGRAVFGTLEEAKPVAMSAHNRDKRHHYRIVGIAKLPIFLELCPTDGQA